MILYSFDTYKSFRFYAIALWPSILIFLPLFGVSLNFHVLYGEVVFGAALVLAFYCLWNIRTSLQQKLTLYDDGFLLELKLKKKYVGEKVLYQDIYQMKQGSFPEISIRVYTRSGKVFKIGRSFSFVGEYDEKKLEAIFETLPRDPYYKVINFIGKILKEKTSLKIIPKIF